jgi:pyruvate kinase
MAHAGAHVAREQEFAHPGQRIILVAGVPFGTPGATNMLRIAFVSASD